MFVKEGARKLLLNGERQKFLSEEWPRISETIQRLGLTAKELLDASNGRRSSEAEPGSADPDAAKRRPTKEDR